MIDSFKHQNELQFGQSFLLIRQNIGKTVLAYFILYYILNLLNARQSIAD